MLLTGVAGVLALAALAGCSTAPHETETKPEQPAPSLTVGDSINVEGLPNPATVIELPGAHHMFAYVETELPADEAGMYTEYLYGRGCVMVTDPAVTGVELLTVKGASDDLAVYEDRPRGHRSAEIACVTTGSRQVPDAELDEKRDALGDTLTVVAVVHTDKAVIADA